MITYNDIVLKHVLKTLDDIESRISVYTDSIQGFKETMFMDELYIEFIGYLDKTRLKLENIVELIKETSKIDGEGEE